MSAPKSPLSAMRESIARLNALTTDMAARTILARNEEAELSELEKLRAAHHLWQTSMRAVALSTTAKVESIARIAARKKPRANLYEIQTDAPDDAPPKTG